MEDYEAQGLLHEQFREQAKKTPDAAAVVSVDGSSLSYAQLDDVTDKVAVYLRKLGVTVDSVVAIYMERKVDYVIAYLAILKAGGAYLPLDVSYPESLIDDILKDVEPIAVFVCMKIRANFPADVRNTIIVEEGWLYNIEIDISNADEKFKIPVEMTLDNLAYTVYSSGTTGRPKGIQCPHRGAVFSYYYRHLAYPYSADDREACNVFFVWEIMRPLLRGVPLYVIPDTVIYDPISLLFYLESNRITRQLYTPSLFEALLDLDPELIKRSLKTMRLIIFCGEVVTTGLFERCVRLLPWIRFINLYSVSESHDMTCGDLNQWYDSLKGNIRDKKFCPVGKIIEGVEVAVLNDNLEKQPLGISGELYVGGPTLARGYLNRPDLNATRFISVLNKKGEQHRFYKTGDWGYMLSDGSFEICGRCDSMVKVRGYSIEIQAVEAILVALDAVNTCVVMVMGDEGEDKYLVAYIVPEDKSITKKSIRGEMKKRLPFYMIPSYFVFLESIPLLAASGKFDKKVLRDLDFLNNDTQTDQDGRPTTDTEKVLVTIWCEVLKLKTIDIQETFFDLGGHSLLASRLLCLTNERFGTELHVSDLFANSSIAEMAAEVNRRVGGDTTDAALRKDNDVDLKTEVENHDVVIFRDLCGMDIQLRAFWRSAYYHKDKWNSGRVLLTGATGFLGAFILRELLLKTKTHIFCIVRELPDQNALQRVHKTMLDYHLLTAEGQTEVMVGNRKKMDRVRDEFKSRVIAIKGDISLVNMGMSVEDYHYLCMEIDYVIHAAAYVNLIYPYKALHGPNVLGTQNVVKFSCESKIKPLHYVSTNAVFPEVSNTKWKENNDISKLNSKDLLSGYSRSKWVAEQLVHKAIQKGLPAVIYRLGNLSGDRETSAWNPTDLNLMLLQAASYSCTAPRLLPLDASGVEFTPVDWVAQVVVECCLPAMVCSALGKVYHVINPQPIATRFLFGWISENGYPLQLVPLNEWKLPILSSEMPNKDKFIKLLDNLVKSDIYFINNKMYEFANINALLEDLNMEYPTINEALLDTYFNNLRKCRQLPPKCVDSANVDCNVSYIDCGLDPKPLNKKVIIVTGASSGIGKAIAMRLATEGAWVSLAARREDKLKELCDYITSTGGRAVYTKCDVTDVLQVNEMVTHTKEKLGKVDIIVNNAGVMYYTHMRTVNTTEWNNQIDVNCKGVTNCIGAVLPGMLESGRGHIINMSSDAGKMGFAGLAVYCGTKFFVEGLSRSMRAELADTGIKITCIQPGDVKTELLKHTTDMDALKTYAADGTTKVLEPSDVANAVFYAASQPEYVAINEILIEPRTAPIS